MTEITIPVLAVLALNGSAFVWLAQTLWAIDRRILALEIRAGLKKGVT